MSVPDAAAPRGAMGRDSALLSALLAAFACLALLRVALIPSLLDHVMNYTTDEGSIVEKIHPTFYGFIGVGLMAVLCLRVELDAWAVKVCRAALAFIGGILALLVFLALAGRSGSAGYLIDTYVTACCAMLLFLFPPSWRQGIGTMLLMFLVLSALIGLAEFATKTRLLPYDAHELTFRPTGLSNHPLELGLGCATAVGFVAASGWPRAWRLASGVLLVVGAFAAGARLAALVGLADAFLLALIGAGAGVSSRRALERRIIVVVAAILFIPLLVGGLYAVGALQRFQGGLVDESAMARVNIYGVFDFLSWSQILFGADLARVRQIALEQFGLPFIESSFVIFIVQFGVAGAALFLGLLANLVRVLLAGARTGVWIGVLSFFVISMSNNGLSTKGSGIFLLFALMIAFRGAPERIGGAG